MNGVIFGDPKGQIYYTWNSYLGVVNLNILNEKPILNQQSWDDSLTLSGKQIQTSTGF